MYDFPVHECTQEQNSRPNLSSIVWQCKWPSLSRKIVKIQKFCCHGNVTLHVSLCMRSLPGIPHSSLNSSGGLCGKLSFRHKPGSRMFLFWADSLVTRDRGSLIRAIVLFRKLLWGYWGRCKFFTDRGGVRRFWGHACWDPDCPALPLAWHYFLTIHLQRRQQNIWACHDLKHARHKNHESIPLTIYLPKTVDKQRLNSLWILLNVIDSTLTHYWYRASWD